MKINNTAEKVVDFIKNSKTIQKYIYPYSWVSGCSTMVHPIMIFKNSIEVQLNSDARKNYLRKVMTELSAMDGVCDVRFNPYDGSCPKTLEICVNGAWAV